jgi:hypothetical protein
MLEPIRCDNPHADVQREVGRLCVGCQIEPQARVELYHLCFECFKLTTRMVGRYEPPCLSANGAAHRYIKKRTPLFVLHQAVQPAVKERQ